VVEITKGEPKLVLDFRERPVCSEDLQGESRKSGDRDEFYLCILNGSNGEVERERPWLKLRERGMNGPPLNDIRAHLAIAHLEGSSGPPSLVLRNGPQTEEVIQ
jgi:hypothetical protein